MKKLLWLPGGVILVALFILFAVPSQHGEESPLGLEAQAKQQNPVRAGLAGSLISSEDLPPAGTRSLFDHLVRENGSLPFPFDRVLTMLANYDEQGRQPHSLLIPDGRSLLKGQAHFAAPRIVVAADAKPAPAAGHMPMLRGRLFLGFVEEASEIEVISYNEAAGRFEFQLVENYCEGCVPRIVYAKRAICTTCHAGGGPIFPVRPWAETNANSHITARLAEELSTEQYYSSPLDRNLNDGQKFDDLTDIGNVIPATQQIWLDGCGEAGNDCRRHMFELALLWAINPNALDQQLETVDQLKQAQARSWPQEGIALDNGNLKNRDPLRAVDANASFFEHVKALFASSEPDVRTGDKLADFEQLPRLPVELDPLSRRAPIKVISAQDLDGVYGLAQMFSQLDIERIERLANYDPALISAAIRKMSDLYFDPVPIHRVPLLDALSVVLGGQARPYCCDSTAGMSEPVVQGEPPLQLAEGSVLEPFESYCFACHRGNPAARLNFMAGASEEEVLERIKSTDEIREVLDYQRYLGTRKEGTLMPPVDSWQREALDAAQARGVDHLSAMRDQVPALFEF